MFIDMLSQMILKKTQLENIERMFDQPGKSAPPVVNDFSGHLGIGFHDIMQTCLHASSESL